MWASDDGDVAAVSRSRFRGKRSRSGHWCRSASHEVNQTTVSSPTGLATVADIVVVVDPGCADACFRGWSCSGVEKKRLLCVREGELYP